MIKGVFVLTCSLLSVLSGVPGWTQSLPSQPRVPTDPAYQVPIVTSCWREVRPFSSFKTGEVEYCRGHLKYTPSALDCYSFEAEVCSVFLPATHEWTETRQALPPVVVECPDESPPPLCPRNTLLER
jgi:hypothetical protein